MGQRKTIAFANQKGGVGKTTTVANIGVGLSREGQRVLLVDLDPQANLSFSLGVPDPAHNTFDFITGKATVEQAGVAINAKLDLIASTIDTAALEAHLSSKPGREIYLAKALQGARYDYILLDCPPSLGIITLNALKAANEVFVPISLEVLPTEGLRILIETIELTRENINPDLRLAGIIPTIVEPRRKLSKQLLEALKEKFGAVVFDTLIRKNVDIAEAPNFHQSVIDYNPRSNGAVDYMNLAREIIRRNA